jgi:hypothetical protein
MAIKGAIRIEVEHDTVFPAGALFLSVDRQPDYERRGKGDDQARDKESGERVWVVKVMDEDPEARQSEVRVKVTAPHMPVPPAPQVEGFPPRVEFVGLTLTPYLDSSRRCSAERCQSRQAYSLRATGIREPGSGVRKPERAAANGGTGG